MKAQELRIGNYVHDPTWGTMVIESILGGTLRVYLHTPDKEYLADFPLSGLQPIPLTEEWLIKFGFRMDVWRRYGNGQDWQPEYPRTDYRDFKRDDLVIRIETMSYISKEDKPGELVKHESKSIMVDDNHLPFRSFPEYVHQLQNLYFALTGEELTIK